MGELVTNRDDLIPEVRRAIDSQENYKQLCRKIQNKGPLFLSKPELLNLELLRRGFEPGNSCLGEETECGLQAQDAKLERPRGMERRKGSHLASVDEVPDWSAIIGVLEYWKVTEGYFFFGWTVKLDWNPLLRGSNLVPSQVYTTGGPFVNPP